jgi:hypothetical protein
MAEASGVVELGAEVVLQFIERNRAANTVGKTRSDLNIWHGQFSWTLKK